MPILESSSSILTPLGSLGNMKNSTGGTIRTAGGFRYHVYNTAGTFTFNAAGLGNVNVLVVGGGGNGGTNIAGGGGAGGVINYQSVIMRPGTYNITVGTGGLGGPDYRTIGSVNGGDSTLQYATGTLTAVGGGHGNNGNGGSGGGANHSGGSGGTAVVGQGNIGGNPIPYAAPYYSGGGGGGFSTAGANATSSGNTGAFAGAGGQGLTLDANTASLPEFSGMTVIASGGGGTFLRNQASGGYSQGLGGTGAGNGGGSTQSTVLFLPTSATSYGSGAGGALWEATGNYLGTAGKNGVVVIRYPA
jgi:hypothetical protein